MVTAEAEEESEAERAIKVMQRGKQPQKKTIDQVEKKREMQNQERDSD